MTIDLDGQAQDLRQSEVAKLKEWLRFNRKASGVTRAHLAKRVRLTAKHIHRWESLSESDLPTLGELLAAAAAMGVLAPVVPDGLLPEEVFGDSAQFVDPNAPMQRSAQPGASAIADPAQLKRWMRQARKSAKISQAVLADRLGLHVLTVHKWEHLAEQVLPPLDRLEQIAASCGVPLPTLDIDLGLFRQGRRIGPVSVPLPPAASTMLGEIEQTAERLALRFDGLTSQQRNASLFAEHYGGGKSLKSLGEAQGLTRERVRQIIEKMVDFIPHCPLPRERFEELCARCEALGVTTITDAEAELADLLGGVSLACVQTYAAHILGESLPVELDIDQAVPMLRTRGLPNWQQSVLRHARRQIRFNGAALFGLIWATTQAEHETPIAQQTLRAVLQAVPGFIWLDPTEQWFWFGHDDGANRIVDWSRRILAAAERSVDVEHVLAGVLRYTTRYDDSSPITAMLPTAEVLLQMLGSCPDIEVKQKNNLKLVDASLLTGADSDSVGERVLALLDANGGVMARGDITTELVGNQGVLPISLQVHLANSPLLRRLEHGVYAIRGRRLLRDHVTRAWQNSLGSSHTDIEALPDGGFAWDATLSRAVVVHDRMFLPKGIARSVPSGPLHLPDGGALSVVGARENAQLRGVPRAAFAIGGQEGDRLRITVWPNTRACTVEPA